jgi:hypothetical protein
VGAPIVDTAVDFPTRALRPFINQYAGFRVSGQPPSLHFGLPSSSVNLIISLSGPIDLIQMPNSVQAPSPLTALVSGLHDVPAVVRQSSDTWNTCQSAVMPRSLSLTQSSADSLAHLARMNEMLKRSLAE